MATPNPVSWNTVLPQVLSLLNAAGYTNLVQGSINSASNILNSTDPNANWVAADVGKPIIVPGAGAAGAPLITTISGRNSATQITLTVNAGTTVANASISYGSILQDDRRSIFEVVEAIFEADTQICLYIASSGKNDFRPDFTSVVTLLHGAGLVTNSDFGASLPDSLGPVGIPEIMIANGDNKWVPATPSSFDLIVDVVQDGNNGGPIFGTPIHNAAGSVLGGYYYITPNEINVYWTGYQIRFFVPTFVTDRVNYSLQSPDVYTPFLVALAIMSMMKEGDNAPLFQEQSQIAERGLQWITGGEKTPPPIETLLQARQDSRYGA